MKTSARVLAGSRALLSVFNVACMKLWGALDQDPVLHMALRCLEANLARNVKKLGRIPSRAMPASVLTLGPISVGDYLRAAGALAKGADDEAVWYSLGVVEGCIERLLKLGLQAWPTISSCGRKL